jgi:hypothetical protein
MNEQSILCINCGHPHETHSQKLGRGRDNYNRRYCIAANCDCGDGLVAQQPEEVINLVW